MDTKIRGVPTVAILGAGPIGSAIAQRLCQRGRVRDLLLIDATANAAAGKALDIQQSGPVEHFDTRVSAAGDVLASTHADVIVVADEIAGGEWEGDRGLTLLRQLVRAGTTSPIVFAGPHQTGLMETGWRELKMNPQRMVGTAASAMSGAARALAGLELNLSGVDLAVVGRPPAFTIAWSAASVEGCLLPDRIPAHRLLALSASLSKLWPPGPQAIGAATAPLVEALLTGSRRLHPALTVIDGEYGARGKAVMLPLEIGIGVIRRHVLPSLSPQERTELMNAIAD